MEAQKRRLIQNFLLKGYVSGELYYPVQVIHKNIAPPLKKKII